MDSAVKVHRKSRHRHQRNHINNNSNRNSSNLSDTITTVQTLQQTQATDTISVSELETIYSSYAQQPQTVQEQQQPITNIYEQKQELEYQKEIDMPITSSKVTQHTLLLVNGELPYDEQATIKPTTSSPATQQEDTSIMIDDESLDGEETIVEVCDKGNNQSGKPPLKEDYNAPSAAVSSGANGGGGSSRNSSGDAMSLRETLQHLPTPALTTHRSHHSRHSRTHSVSPHSPQSPLRYRTHEPGDGSNSGSSGSLQHQQQPPRTGIHGFMERELKVGSPTSSALSASNRKLQSLSDPAGSPAPRSLRSRSSLERSPRRKRSKSESRRRRERKLIAAGEMEVRQANETLMRYLKQCSEMNDASLSGELEIDQNYEDRRVQRKTKSQRDKRGHIINKLYAAGGLTSLLKELSDDIIPAEGEEIYNPFTPVVSPTEEDTPAHIEKMFLQTSSGYRQVEKCYYCYNHKYHNHHQHRGGGDGVSANNTETTVNNMPMCSGSGHSNGSLNLNSSESRCLLDTDCHR